MASIAIPAATADLYPTRKFAHDAACTMIDTAVNLESSRNGLYCHRHSFYSSAAAVQLDAC